MQSFSIFLVFGIEIGFSVPVLSWWGLFSQPGIGGNLPKSWQSNSI